MDLFDQLISRDTLDAAYLVTYPLFEKEYEACSHAYRVGRSVKTAIMQINQLRDQGYRYVVDADIDNFFDRKPRPDFEGMEVDNPSNV